MSQNTERRLIESDTFGNLLPEIDEKAAKEKGSGGRPVYWEMIFWWTRKPLISARAFTAAALLPENYPLDKFERMIGLSKNIPHKYQPVVNSEFKNFTILDPFAGFGSIPLEAKRLKVGKVIASELLPTAYVFLKAILEYPKYGTKLLDDLKKYGKELIKSIEDDVKELYGEYSGFVGTWEVKCPHCGNYTPLVNQWWLLALKGRKKKKEEGESEEEVKSGNFKRLVFMKPEVSGGQLRIKIIDLNKELNRKTIPAKKTKDRVIIDGKEYRVPEGNVDAKHSYAKCLFCNTTLPGKGDKWYVREAIKDWNERYEKYLNGEISLEELQNAKARPTLLVKFKGEGKDLVFEEINGDDMKKFWESFEKLRNIDINNIPIESVASYASRNTTIAWGMDKFYKLFDARQLIIFSKIIAKLDELRERIKGEEEYKEAIITYLTIGFLNHIRHNCFLTLVDSSRKFIAHALSLRRFAFTWNWVEISPLANIIGSLSRSLDHVIEGLEYLVQTNTDSKIEIINSDVNELTLSDKVDVIVTDPPYADDVSYPEVSDFYYVWLKRTIPFPYKTQWEEFVPRDIGVDEERSKVFGDDIGSYEYFRNKLAQAFKNLAEILKDDGLMVTFYNHTSPDAWISLLYGGWYYSKFKISAIHAITTEDENRVNARGTMSLNKSMVIVWRKKAKGQKLIQEAVKEALNYASTWVSTRLLGKERIIELSIDAYIEVLGKVLETLTKYEKLIGLKGEGVEAVENLITNYAFPVTAQALVEGLAKGVGTKINDPHAVFYTLVKVLLPPKRGGRRKMDSTTTIFLNITGNIDANELQESEIIEKEKDGVILNEPENDGTDVNSTLASLEKLPHVRDAINGKYEFKTPVQLLHYLEYEALKHGDKLQQIVNDLRNKTRFVDDAIAMAKIFAEVLNDNDVEKEPCKRIVGKKEGILKFTS
jgi:putative DNA methylase